MIRMIAPFLVYLSFWSCSEKEAAGDGVLKTNATLDLKEASGLAYINGKLWCHQDSGNDAALYTLSVSTGKKHKYDVNGVNNNDWEDLASDADGNLYIGDFGNNDNDRHNLQIYKVNPANPAEVVYTINFYYPEQQDFPPTKELRNFDCEAFFEYNGYFYLFSKNRAFNSDGTVLVHKLQNNQGYHAAAAAGSFKTCDNFRKCAIAGADISPDGKTVALISGNKLWLLTGYTGDDFAGGTLTPYELGDVTQKEGICFKDNNTLYIVDERDGNTGGKLYSLKLTDLLQPHE